MSPDGSTGATDTSEAVGAAAIDVAADPQAAPSHPTAEAAPGGDDPTSGGAPEGADARSDAAQAVGDDDADLASYPEAVRDDFKALSPEKRKALYQEAEKRAEARIEENRRRLDKIEADRKAEEDRKAAIRAKLGKYVGDEPITKVGRDGVERTLPTLEETMRLNQNRRGREELWDKYSLDEDGIEEHIENLVERRDMLDATTDLLEDRALGRIDGRLRDGFREAGLDPSLLDDLPPDSVHLIVPTVARHLREEFAAEKKRLVETYEGRVAATNVNAEAMRGQVLAATSRSPLPGGRSGAPRNTRAELDRIRTEIGDAAFAERAMRGEFAHYDLTK